MENKEQQMPVQQVEQSQELSDQELQEFSAERAKELFEYEMSEVLLNFNQEVGRIKRKDVSEYLDMEVPKADIKFEVHQKKLKGIDFSDKNTDISHDEPKETKVEITPISVEVPETPDISIEGKKDDIEIKALSGAVFAELGLSEDGSLSAGVDFAPPSFTSPTVSGKDSFAVPEKFSLEPEISAQTVDVSPIAVPDTKIGKSVFKTPAAYILDTDTKSVDVPAIDTGVFSIDSVKAPEVSMSVSEVKEYNVPTIPNLKSVEKPELSIPDNAPELFDTESFKKQSEIEVEDITVPVSNVSPFDVPAISVDNTDVKAQISVPSTDIGNLMVMTLPESEAPNVDFPDVPKKPDFSMYYTDIVESLRAEM